LGSHLQTSANIKFITAYAPDHANGISGYRQAVASLETTSWSLEDPSGKTIPPQSRKNNKVDLQQPQFFNTNNRPLSPPKKYETLAVIDAANQFLYQSTERMLKIAKISLPDFNRRPTETKSVQPAEVLAKQP
jgi:hypothetical protein